MNHQDGMAHTAARHHGADRILALDTASGQCSVALLSRGQLIARAVLTARDHARLLLPMVDEALAEAGLALRDLDGIAFGRGPGSFTGVRIAAAVTQGLAAGAGLPVLPISDLRALAERARLVVAATGSAPAGSRLLACMDARMGEVYWGLFLNADAAVEAAEGGERLSAPDGLLRELQALKSTPGQVVGAAGMGLGAWPSLIAQLDLPSAHCLAAAEPHAGDIARLAAADLSAGASWQDPETAQPVYLRDRVVQAPL
jgi:tRNA threonylcarbamoyladenosine biosynthesis protein TsaB